MLFFLTKRVKSLINYDTDEIFARMLKEILRDVDSSSFLAHNKKKKTPKTLLNIIVMNKMLAYSFRDTHQNKMSENDDCH